MSSRQISYKLEVDWDGSGGFSVSEDESNNLLNASGNEEIANPVDSAFASGGYTTEATFTLANKARRYSPTNASSPIYSYITSGKYYQKKVKLTVTIAGVSYTAFLGYIKSISESPITPDSNGTVTLKCASGDAFLIGKKATSLASVTKSFFDTGKDEGQLIAQTLSICGNNLS